MENPEPKISYAERPVSFTDDDFKDLPTFQKAAEREVGGDEHGARIVFSDLNEEDSFLAEKFMAGILTRDAITDARISADDAKQRSSGIFRGWLANMLHKQAMRRVIDQSKQGHHE